MGCLHNINLRYLPAVKTGDLFISSEQYTKRNVKICQTRAEFYADIFFDFLSNGKTDIGCLDILRKIKQQFNITEERAVEIEETVRKQLNNIDSTHFYSDNEKDYYNFLINFIENDDISYKYIDIIDKRRIKNSISYLRAEELKVMAINNKKYIE